VATLTGAGVVGWDEMVRSAGSIFALSGGWCQTVRGPVRVTPVVMTMGMIFGCEE
jgi:hypothetical protein